MNSESNKTTMSATSGPVANYNGESTSEKFTRKFKEAPFVPIGIAGLLGAVGVGAYQYKHRGGMSTSVYLMQLRVTAQGMVVGAITLGIGYKLVSQMLKKRQNNLELKNAKDGSS